MKRTKHSKFNIFSQQSRLNDEINYSELYSFIAYMQIYKMAIMRIKVDRMQKEKKRKEILREKSPRIHFKLKEDYAVPHFQMIDERTNSNSTNKETNGGGGVGRWKIIQPDHNANPSNNKI